MYNLKKVAVKTHDFVITNIKKKVICTGDLIKICPVSLSSLCIRDSPRNVIVISVSACKKVML